MTKRVQRYGLTAAAMSVLTGLQRELIINTDDWAIHVQDGVTAGGKKISTDVANALVYQPLNSELTAIAGLAANGMLARTGAHVYVPRTITGTANEITLTNGDGVAGNPVVSLPAALTFTGKTVTGGSFTTPSITTPTFVTSMKLPFSVESGGRLTLVTALPVMQSDQTAKTTVFYTPWKHNRIVGYDGSNIVALPFSEQSLALNGTDNVSGGIYDIFEDMVGAQLGTGPVWTTLTAGSGARGTGAGTTELEMFNGMWVNKNAIVLRAGGVSLGSKPVRTCRFLGSIYMTANGQTGVAFKPAAALGGSNCIMGLSNAENRVPSRHTSRDSTGSWTYATNTWQVLNIAATGSGLNNRVSWLDCLGQVVAKARHDEIMSTTSSGMHGVTFNSTTATPAGNVAYSSLNGAVPGVAEDQLISLGFNYAQAMQDGWVGTTTYFGVQNGAQVQQLMVELEY